MSERIRLELDVESVELPLSHPFVVSRGSRSTTSSVVVHARSDHAVGIGEGVPHARYEQTVEESARAISACRVRGFRTPQELGLVLRRLERELLGQSAALCAIDIALHDWLARCNGVSVRELIGIESSVSPSTSYTLSLDDPAKMAAAARDVGYSILKLKLGDAADRDRVAAVRAATSATLRVDVNEGWSDREHAIAMIEWLDKQGVELVEQPMAATRHSDAVWLKARSPLPLIADEACCKVEDVQHVAEAYHGVNVKLDKCGGLRLAEHVIEAARELDLKVMIGCMTASSLSLTAHAVLAPLSDYLDLDGHMWLSTDPYSGLIVSEEGALRMPDGPGLGVIPLSAAP